MFLMSPGMSGPGCQRTIQQAYYSVLSAYEALNVAQENQTRAKDHLDLAQQRKDAGVAVEADVLRMRVEVERRLSVVRAENLVRIGKGNLNTAMGLPPELELEIVDAMPRIIPPETVAGMPNHPHKRKHTHKNCRAGILIDITG
jgi:outer membrane protein TolC